jgi:hypothetical protein
LHQEWSWSHLKNGLSARLPDDRKVAVSSGRKEAPDGKHSATAIQSTIGLNREPNVEKRACSARKPFDVLAGGLNSKISRGDWI